MIAKSYLSRQIPRFLVSTFIAISEYTGPHE